MNIQRITHIGKRLIELGPRTSYQLLRNKIIQHNFHTTWRAKALTHQAAHTWQTIATNHNIQSSFDAFLKQLQTIDLPHTNQHIDADLVIQQAHAYNNNYFDLLGSGTQCFALIPWHQDFRLQAQQPQADCTFDKNAYYKDIEIQTGQTDQLIKDIKIPWELSRFAHALTLGHAYQLTNDDSYAQTFTAHITDWLDNNPYLLGPNWVCPMEVGIRAMHWILAFDYFKDAPTISADFWQRFATSLYDHAHYLEHNWELYDAKTSNHYLSDLVGYLYICHFLQHLPGFDKKFDWCTQEIMRECDKQIFDEGSDYEGSTTYHKLVMQLFMHAYALLRTRNVTMPDTFIAKLAAMQEFIDWCTPMGGQLVTIGDNDSGELQGLPLDTFLLRKNTRGERGEYIYNQKETALNLTKENKTETDAQKNLNPFAPSVSSSQNEKCIEGYSFGVKLYPSFGLSIIKTPTVHITLRHHAYNKRQPSGHFHNDALSITLAYNGIPIFIDPGSYVYTPSKIWRNQLRSVAVHNTFYLDSIEPTPFDDRLFALALDEKTIDYAQPNNYTLYAQHNLYQRFDVQAQRTVTLDEANGKITIIDSWHTIDTQTQELPATCWNFTLHPEIEVDKQDNAWILLHKKSPIALLQSDLNFEIQAAWVSLAYGSKVESLCLRAKTDITKSCTSKITF